MGGSAEPAPSTSAAIGACRSADKISGGQGRHRSGWAGTDRRNSGRKLLAEFAGAGCGGRRRAIAMGRASENRSRADLANRADESECGREFDRQALVNGQNAQCGKAMAFWQ